MSTPASRNPVRDSPSPQQPLSSTSPTATRVRVNSSTQNRKSSRASTSGTSADLREGVGIVDEEEDVVVDPEIRIPLAPPRDPELFDSDAEFAEYRELEKASSWQHLPLFLVVLPPVGAIFWGRAENWSDAIILILICFYLYQLIKVPWDLYYASHGRYILKGKQPVFAFSDQEDLVLRNERHHAASVLKRTELVSLAITLFVPIIGASLLRLVRGLLSDPDRYINKFTISLFSLATSVKPLLHLAKLAKNSALYYQEAVWFPSTEVHLLRRRVEILEAKLDRVVATKTDVRTLRDGIDIPLGQLSKAVRRFDRKEEILRHSSEERFAELEARMELLNRMRVEQEEAIRLLRDDQKRSMHPIAALFKVVNHLLMGQRQFGRRRREAVKWFERGVLYYVFLPVNVSALAIDWVRSAEEEDGDSTT